MLLHKVWATLHGYHGCHLGDKENTHDHQQCEPHAQGEHGEEHGDDGKEGAYRRRKGLHHHLTQGVYVVGIKAHDIAVFVAVEVANRQALHFFKHFITHAFHGALGDDRHDPAVSKGRKHPCPEEQAHSADGPQEPHEIRIGHANHRRDIVVNQGAQEERGSGAGDGADKHQDHNHPKQGFVGAEVV